MSASVQFDGLDELRAALRNMPTHLRGQAANIVEAAGNAAATEIRAAYGKHRHTGNLQEGVTVEHERQAGVTARSVVKSTAPHAYIFENGTQARHTDLGWNRGVMPAGGKPAGHIFVPVVVRHRRAMEAKLEDMLKGEGFEVSGA